MPGTPVNRSNPTAVTPGSRRMVVTPARGRGAPLSYTSVEPADAMPGTPSRARDARANLQALTGLVKANNAPNHDAARGHPLDVTVTVAGLEDGEADALRAGVLITTTPSHLADSV